MHAEWWERPACFVCDYWWVILLALLLGLAAWFAWPYVFPPAPASPLPVPTASRTPGATPSPQTVPPATGSPTPTSTRVTTLGSGDVQVTLTWNTSDDLDLWVIGPDSEKIYFAYKASSSGGRLDVDANPGCQYLTSQPVENVYWPLGEAPEGRYEVLVNYFMPCVSTVPVAFSVRVLVDGEVTEYQGTLAAQAETVSITTIER